VVHLSDHDDETSALSTWHIPACHFLESWGDARAHDGTLSIQQPLIQPLYAECKSPHEVLAAFELNPNRSPLEIVQRYHQEQRPGLAEAAFEKQWIKWIHDGVVPNTAARPRTLAFRGTIAPVAPIGAADKVDDQNIEVIFRPDPTLWDGRYANNAWLQELPKPLLKTVWDNAAVMSFAMAQRLNVSNDSMVRVRVPASGKMISLPVIIQPGHPDGAVTLHYGYGRTRAGKVGNDTGFNVYPLRPADALHFATGGIEAAGGTHRVAHTAHHNLIDPDKKTVDGIHERPLVQIATWDQFSKNPAQVVHEETRKSLPVTGLTQQGRIDTHKEHAATGEHGGPGEGHKAGEGEHKAAPFGGQHKGEGEHGPSDGKDKKRKGFPTLYDTSRDTVLNDDEISYAWGMSVDTSTCIGCNACVIACQSENNSAVTGKDQVLMGRTLHWMRIDTYYHGDVAEPEVYFQPVMCMHCEKAPCEPVCPVIATQHSPEGINEMVYNRCIGTRYCSNNCPYKVRRFNYLQYSDQDTPQIQLMANPDVTVRARGVMEKCTYCIQRVHEGRIQTEKEDRLLRDGEVLTACQQVCPTNTIIFGDIRNEKSLVSRLKNEPHDYGMLTELNTYPRTTYLAKIHNPNPALRIAQNEEGTEAIKPADHPLKPEGDASGGIGVTGH
jgi:molybdopterin-containing oxidoreductase family iron-sulfur binding subunit